MLDANALTVWRGNVCLFEALSFRVLAGRSLLVRGANGAGKTTLLRVLCGLTRAEEGQVSWNGAAGESALRGLIAYSGHQSGLNADLTVRENLTFYAALGETRCDWRNLMEPLNLGRCVDLEVRHLSAGQKRRAALARVFISAVPVWLLDEPLTNLDDAGREFVEAQIETHLASDGLAVIAMHGDIRLPAHRLETLVLGA